MAFFGLNLNHDHSTEDNSHKNAHTVTIRFFTFLKSI